jgi:hypothetical protein
MMVDNTPHSPTNFTAGSAAGIHPVQAWVDSRNSCLLKYDYRWLNGSWRSENSIFLRNLGSYSLSDRASYPGRPESSETKL